MRIHDISHSELQMSPFPMTPSLREGPSSRGMRRNPFRRGPPSHLDPRAGFGGKGLSHSHAIAIAGAGEGAAEVLQVGR
jgi:hypothetical protein